MNAPVRIDQTALKAVGLKKRFKTGRSYVEVLKGVDYEARHGDLTMVMGPSGSASRPWSRCCPA